MRQSTYEGPPARIGDPDADQVDRRAIGGREDLAPAVARPSCTRPAIAARSTSWLSTSRSSMMPCGMLASSASARRCSMPRLGSRGGSAISGEVFESFADDRRAVNTGLKNRSERVASVQSPLRWCEPTPEQKLPTVFVPAVTARDAWLEAEFQFCSTSHRPRTPDRRYRRAHEE